jgi:hypothetical protein
VPLSLRERFKFSIAPVRSDNSSLMWHLLKARNDTHARHTRTTHARHTESLRAL